MMQNPKRQVAKITDIQSIMLGKYIKEEGEADAACKQSREGILRRCSNVEATPHQQQVQEQQQDHSDEAELFTDDGENKVCRAFRQKLQLALAAVQPAFAEHTASGACAGRAT